MTNILEILQGAAPHEVDAHRGFLQEALNLVGQQGGNPQVIAQQAGAPNADPHGMNPEQLINTTIQLARTHPEIVNQVAQRFPQAQPLLNSLLGGEQLASGNPIAGVLGGLLKG